MAAFFLETVLPRIRSTVFSQQADGSKKFSMITKRTQTNVNLSIRIRS